MAKIKLNSRKKLGQFVKWKRQQLGWSQQKLAQEAFGEGAAHTQIYRIENGTGDSMRIMDKVLAALGSDVEFKVF
jgi:transcriptional regulator with XRE-family HTH domain